MPKLLDERRSLFVIAAVVPIIVVFLVGITFWTSFVQGSPGAGVPEYSLSNYIAVYSDPFTYSALLNTLG